MEIGFSMINIVNKNLQKKITTLQNFVEMRQTTLNDPKIDFKKSLGTLKVLFVIFEIRLDNLI